MSRSETKVILFETEKGHKRHKCLEEIQKNVNLSALSFNLHHFFTKLSIGT